MSYKYLVFKDIYKFNGYLKYFILNNIRIYLFNFIYNLNILFIIQLIRLENNQIQFGNKIIL